MTRWLAAARQASGAPTKLTKPTKPNPKAPSEGHDATTGGVLSVKSVLSEGGVTRQIARLREQVATMKAEGVPHVQAVWRSALATLVLPDERAEYFEGGALKPRYQQASFAIGEGVVVTFHRNGRVSFFGTPGTGERGSDKTDKTDKTQAQGSIRRA